MRTPSNSAERPNWDKIELLPDLPVAVFTSMERWNSERIRALALYCSDGRWGEAFDEFCQRHLSIPRYDRWAVPGGPAWLAADDDGDAYFRTAREQLDFLVRVHELEQIVLITHFGCAYYGNRHNQEPRECLPAQTADVRAARAALLRWYPHMDVKSYLAMRNNTLLSFHRIDD